MEQCTRDSCVSLSACTFFEQPSSKNKHMKAEDMDMDFCHVGGIASSSSAFNNPQSEQDDVSRQFTQVLKAPSKAEVSATLAKG